MQGERQREQTVGLAKAGRLIDQTQIPPSDYLCLRSPSLNSLPEQHRKGMHCFSPWNFLKKKNETFNKGLPDSCSPLVRNYPPFPSPALLEGFLLVNLARLCQPHVIRSRSSAESFSFSLGTIFYLLFPHCRNAADSSNAPEEKQSPSPKIYTPSPGIGAYAVGR